MSTAIKPLPLYTADHKVAGYCRGHIFRKELLGSKHMIKVPAGWAIDADIFNSLKKYGITTIQVLDKETRKLYVVSRDCFERDMCPQPVSRGHGEQYVLTLAYWRVFQE